MNAPLVLIDLMNAPLVFINLNLIEGPEVYAMYYDVLGINLGCVLL